MEKLLKFAIKSTKDIDKQYQKTKDSLQKLSDRLKNSSEPIFIELIGTPKSGKTTLKNTIYKCFSDYDINVVARRETAEYIPLPKDSKEYDLWIIQDLLKNIIEDLNNKKGQVIVYDRGLLDRLIWLEYDKFKGNMKREDFQRITQLYDMDFLKNYKPIVQAFETSPNLSVQRKGKPGFCVNEANMSLYNKLLNENFTEIIKRSSYVNCIKTDEYQGSLKEFIWKNMNLIIDEINLELDRREEKEQEASL